MADAGLSGCSLFDLTDARSEAEARRIYGALAGQSIPDRDFKMFAIAGAGDLDGMPACPGEAGGDRLG